MTRNDLMLIETALPFAGSDELQPALTCVSINKHIVTTDGHRLMYFDYSKNYYESKLMPKKAAQLLTKHFLFCDVICTDIESQIVAYKEGDKMLVVRLVEEQYPDYKKILPKETFIKLRIGRNRLFQLMESAKIIGHMQHLVEFRISPEELNVSCENIEDNLRFSAKLEKGFEVSGVSEEFRIGFNCTFILQYLNNQGSQSDIVTFEFVEPFKGFIVDGCYLCMSIQLPG